MLTTRRPTLWWDTRACSSVFPADVYDSSTRFHAESGLFLPRDTSRPVTQRDGVRHTTWEDLLDETHVRLRAEDLNLLSRNFSSCRQVFCEHVGVPLAVKTRVRPVRGLLHPRNRTHFTIPIEKVASSSIKREYDYRHLVGCDHKNALGVFAHMFNSTACEYAGSFHWTPSKTSVVTVRNPFRRFLSSLVDHGHLTCDDASCSLLREARQLARQMARREIEMRLFPPHATIHFYTQSYFLSATDMSGAPVRWTRIHRLEETQPMFRENQKDDYSHIMNFLHQDRALRCDICRVYRQDFVCFGYTGCEGCEP